ncbi:MAG: response regulator transcription factor [Aeromicrobium sp.]
MAGVIRVAIVEDHPATAEGLAALLGKEADLTVVGTAPNLETARALITSQTPDVVLSDVELAGGGRGFDLLAGISDTDSKLPAIVFLSSYDYPAFYALALERGAAGYLLKTEPIAEIVSAIRRAAVGGTTFDLNAIGSASRSHRRPSPREVGVISLLADGRSNDEIAVELGITVRTVESHLRRLFARYNVFSRTELAMFAVREGWIALAGRRRR